MSGNKFRCLQQHAASPNFLISTINYAKKKHVRQDGNFHKWWRLSKGTNSFWNWGWCYYLRVIQSLGSTLLEQGFAWGRVNWPHHAPLQKVAGEHIALLPCQPNIHVANLNARNGNLLAAPHAHRVPYKAAMDAIKRDIGNNRKCVWVVSRVWVLTIVGFDHNSHPDIHKRQVSVPDVPHVPASPGRCFDPNPTPWAPNVHVLDQHILDPSWHLTPYWNTRTAFKWNQLYIPRSQ